MSLLARLLMFSALLPLAAAADDLATARSQFVSALALTRAGVAQTSEIEALASYPLVPYLRAARLQRALIDAPTLDVDNQVAAFIDAPSTSSGQTNAGELWSRDLRKVWLQSLADRGVWALFLRYYDDSVTDASLRCQQLRAWLGVAAGGGAMPPNFKEAALARWMSADELPQSCNAVSAWLKDSGALTQDLLEQRAQLALKYGRTQLARQLAASLPPPIADPLLRWAALIVAPQAELKKLIANPDARIDADALLDGFSLLARKDSAAALQLYAPLLRARELSKKHSVQFLRALALGLALDRKPEAIDQYQDLPESALEERDHEWRVRAAIWNGQGKLALKWLDKMPRALAAQSRWRYWHARLLEQTGKEAEARKLYEALCAENGYHSVLAAQRLGHAFEPLDIPSADNAETQSRLAQIISLQRAREAAAVGEYGWVAGEWRRGLEGLPASEKLQAARLAAKWGLYDQTVGIMSALQMFDDLQLLYPQPYTQEVAQAATLASLPPAFLYSVMRQESSFRPDAVSSANAIGLLQLLPRVAREVAKRWQRPLPKPEDLKDPQINLPLGAAHLRELSDKFAGHFIIMLAGYNAGSTAALRWLPAEPKDAEIWIENIPYAETRGYVQRILWNMTVYGWRGSGQPQTLREFLGPVVKLPESS